MYKTAAEQAYEYKVKHTGTDASPAQEYKIGALMNNLGLLGEERVGYLAKMGYPGLLTKQQASEVIGILLKELKR